MRENQSYMTDAFADLENWSEEMKVKEKEIIQNPESAKISNKGLPPIRSLNTTKKKKKKVKESDKQGKDTKKAEKSNTKKINSYDYKSWDKLDVDKMCEEVDKQVSSSSEYTTDDEWEEEQKLVKADWEKERGNQFFKDDLLNEAITCYTRAIEYDPTNAIYPANRAMCLLKQEKYAAAEVDCTLSIALDPKFSKSYHRRATARARLGRLEEARSDYEQLLKLEPNSKLAQIELNKLQQSIDMVQLVFPIIKTESQRSKKPLKRIEIEEINDESAEKIELVKNIEEINQRVKLNSKEQKLFESTSNKKIEILEETVNDVDVDCNVKQLENAKLTDTQTKVDNSEKKIIKKKIPNAPTNGNGYQFKKDWQFLAENLEDLAVYLKKIPPTDYQKIFQNGLESNVLSKILNIYTNFYINDSEKDLLAHLKYLSQVKRFESQIMFLSNDDKKNVGLLFAHLKSSNNDPKEIESLEKLFK